MKRAYESGKPWGVGEACNAYYGTPEQVSNAAKDGGRAYRSFEGRMESVAVDAYNSLANQRKYNASYRSVFNLVRATTSASRIKRPDKSSHIKRRYSIYFFRRRETGSSTGTYRTIQHNC